MAKAGMPFMLAKVLRRVLLGLFCAAVYSTLLLAFDLAVHTTLPLQPYLRAVEPYRLLLVFGLTVGLIASAGALHRSLQKGPGQRLAASLTRAPDRWWLAGCLLIGAVARIGWYLLFPAPQTNDGAAYLELAVKLAHGEDYFIPGQIGGYAFWPPGLPFFLLPSIKLLGSPLWLPLLNNLCLMAVSIFACYWLGLRLLNRPAARLAVLLLAVWPACISSSGLAQKELLLVAILPLALLCYLRAQDGRPLHAGTGFSFVAGILLGLGVLTQPSSGLFPIVCAALEYFRGMRWRGAVLRLFFLALGSILVVAPWTLRNASMFHAFVPVSTNGGFTLYVGNHAKALGNLADHGGSVTPDWLLDWRAYKDLERSRAYMAKAKQWVLDLPLQFAELPVRRFVLIMGDDSDGVYRTLKLGLERNDLSYVLIKALVNCSWLALLLLTLPLFFARGQADRYALATPILGLTILYFVFLHSFAEGGSRHHLGTIWCYLLFAAAALTPAQPGQRGREGSTSDESSATPQREPLPV